jgi:hypothetical protein
MIRRQSQHYKGNITHDDNHTTTLRLTDHHGPPKQTQNTRGEYNTNLARDFTYQQQENKTNTGILNLELLIKFTDIVNNFQIYLNYICILIYLDS